MKVKSLEITMPTYGDDAGQYIGRVSLAGPQGEMQIRLSPKSIGQIFNIIQADAVAQARSAAAAVSQGLADAENSQALIGHTIEV